MFNLPSNNRRLEPCTASGWTVRSSCLSGGRCPHCRQPVTATPAGIGAVRIGNH